MLVASMARGDDPAFVVQPELFQMEKADLGLKPLTGEHYSLYKAAAAKHKFCHHPNLVVFGDRLYAMWSNGVKDEDAGQQRVVYRSSKNGSDWTPVRVLSQTPARGACIAAGFHTTGERLIAFYTVNGGTNFDPKTALFARTLRPGGTWTPARRIISGFFIEGPHSLPGGRLLMAGEHVGRQRETKRMKLLYTDQSDGLSGWREASIDPGVLKTYGYTEPNFFQRGKEIVVAFRNYSGQLYSSVSKDQGQSWTRPHQTNFPDSTARFFTGRLPDGRTILVNNPGPKQFDRSRLTIAFSTDGRHFTKAALVRGGSTKKKFEGKHKLDGWQYPHALVWKQSLWIAYSVNKEDVSISRFALKALP